MARWLRNWNVGGTDLDDPLWSAKVLLESPERIAQVHSDYFVAGADVATTASYQATFEGLSKRGLSRAEAADLIARSVEIAQGARDRFWGNPDNHQGRARPLIAGSVGCYGAYLADGSEYRGRYGLSAGELADFHRPRMEALVRAGADVLACETIPCRVEAEALVTVLGKFPDVPAWLSFSCGDEAHVWEGQPISDCAGVAEGCEKRRSGRDQLHGASADLGSTSIPFRRNEQAPHRLPEPGREPGTRHPGAGTKTRLAPPWRSGESSGTAWALGSLEAAAGHPRT